MPDFHEFRVSRCSLSKEFVFICVYLRDVVRVRVCAMFSGACLYRGERQGGACVAVCRTVMPQAEGAVAVKEENFSPCGGSACIVLCGT